MAWAVATAVVRCARLLLPARFLNGRVHGDRRICRRLSSISAVLRRPWPPREPRSILDLSDRARGCMSHVHRFHAVYELDWVNSFSWRALALGHNPYGVSRYSVVFSTNCVEGSVVDSRDLMPNRGSKEEGPFS